MESYTVCNVFKYMNYTFMKTFVHLKYYHSVYYKIKNTVKLYKKTYLSSALICYSLLQISALCFFNAKIIECKKQLFKIYT